MTINPDISVLITIITRSFYFIVKVRILYLKGEFGVELRTGTNATPVVTSHGGS